MISIDVLVQGTQGTAVHTAAKTFDGIGTDTRMDLTGKIFIALKGDQFDGHDYIDKAIAAGATAVVSHSAPPATSDVTWIQVDDTLTALQNLAQHWRKRWGGKLIGITGSNGKTTVKDFTHTLLSGTFSAIKNEGSFNNHWGLPLTLMRLRSEHQWGVVEMGMNHSGEIAELVRIALPNVVTVTMVGTAHLEFFGSIEKIAEAKEEIYRDTDKGGVGVFNIANAHTQLMQKNWSNKFAKSFTFGDPTADVYFSIEQKNPKGFTIAGTIAGVEGTSATQIWGEQNVHNLMAASCLALAAGVQPQQIWQRLSLCELGWGRNQWVSTTSGASVLFDGYNANPESFRALFANIAESPAHFSQIIGVFGEMRELGSGGETAHQELGKQAAQSVLHEAVFFGPSEAAFRRGFESVKNGKKLVSSNTYKDSLAIKIKDMLDSKTLVVVKGSRGAQLERVVVALDPVDFKGK